jgi:DNA-binding response OmpR family regulator
METILIAEDDQTVQRVLKRLFESNGYHVEIRCDGKSALEAVREIVPTVLILDLGLPVMSGIDVCREIRKQLHILPIVVLSAAIDVTDKIVLLELGADDYVTKPFSPRELLARVQAAIRHTRKSEFRDVAIFDAIRVDFLRMEVTRRGQPVELQALEFKMLEFFLRNAERVVSREELLDKVFGYGSYPATRTIDTHVYQLRNKLENDPANPTHLHTVRGAGYKFVP